MLHPTTDLGHMPWRRLTKRYASASKALSTSNPNTLNTNLPNEQDAIGLTPSSGIVSFMHDGASADFSIWVWCERFNKFTAAQGWIYGAESAALHTKTVAQYAMASFKVPANVPYFIQASAAPNNCIVHDGGKHIFDNTDLTNA